MTDSGPCYEHFRSQYEDALADLESRLALVHLTVSAIPFLGPKPSHYAAPGDFARDGRQISDSPDHAM